MFPIHSHFMLSSLKQKQETPVDSKTSARDDKMCNLCNLWHKQTQPTNTCVALTETHPCPLFSHFQELCPSVQMFRVPAEIFTPGLLLPGATQSPLQMWPVCLDKEEHGPLITSPLGYRMKEAPLPGSVIYIHLISLFSPPSQYWQ